MFFDNIHPKKKAKPKVIQIDSDPVNSDWINPDRDSSDIDCQIFPLGHFGDHDLGYSGCTFCKQQKECLEKNPNVGKSLIAKTKP
jgi:hypothetical protein